jgi:hypothetical protein
MPDSEVPLAALAGGAGAGIGTTVPIVFRFEGLPALLAALAAGSMTGGLLLVALSAARQ